MTERFYSRPWGRRRFIAVSAVCALVLSIPLFLRNTYSSRFLPHAYCYLWDPRLLTLHLVADALIFFSYVAIAVTLWYLLYKGREEIPFHWTFVIFGVFILACGFTHLMEVVTLLRPMYWLAGYVKVITAIASVTTAIALPRLVPRVVKETAVAAALRQNQKRFQSLLDSAPDAMVIANTDSTITLVNSRTEEVFGYSREELLGRKFEMLIAERFRNENRGYSDVFFSDLQPRPMGSAPELAGLRRDGNEFPVEISFVPLQTREGSLVTSTIRDISPRKRAEKKFWDLLEASPDAIVVVDKNGQIVLMNSRLCELFGYSREDMLSQQIEMLIPEDFRLPYQEHRAEFFASAQAPRMGPARELHGLRKDGFEFPIAVSLASLETEDGVLVSSSIRDITEQKQARQLSAAQQSKIVEQAKLLDALQKLGHSEAALQDSEKRYHTLFDENPQPMYVYDIETLKILDANEAMLTRYGYSREECMALSIVDIRPAEEVPKLMKAIEARHSSAYFEKDGGVWKHATKSGEVMDMAIVIHRMNIGGRLAVLCVAQDVKEKRRSQEQLQEAQKLEAIGQLAGGISHDFNNLLGVIMAQAELLSLKLVDVDLRKRTASIIQAVDRGASLAHQLLAFSRKQRLAPGVLSLNSLVTETVRLLGRTLGADIELVTELAQDLWMVNADAGQIQQVLLNLALNARDAMPGGGKLVIRTENVHHRGSPMHPSTELMIGDRVILSVTDTGEGMTERTREKIFEPFFTTKPPGKGTGLGLAMVYGIVKQNYGHIEVSSQLTKGTAFKIHLPRSHSKAVEAPKSIVPGWGSETILIVEDQVALRGAMVDMLKDYGYEVLEAGDGVEALQVVAEQNGVIDLVITDVVMPRMSGSELAKNLKQVQPSIKLLFISGYVGDEINRGNGLDKDVAFVQKPFSPTALVSRVREILG